MTVVYTQRMKDEVERLPTGIQDRLKKLLPFLAQNVRHPYLHTKLLQEQWKGCLAFRITRNYRCIFQVSDERIVLLTIDHRKDIYR
ncbi:MAG: type II toxin-antitoxin system RelE/ParE family toxin [Patescibacteria group bacterium]